MWRTWNIAPLVLSTSLKDFFTSFIVESKFLWNRWPRNYFVKLVDRGECKIIGTRLTMFGRRIIEFLHKRTCQMFSLLAFDERWFLSLDFVRTQWRLFQKCVVCTKLDIYVFNSVGIEYCSIWNNMFIFNLYCIVIWRNLHV